VVKKVANLVNLQLEIYSKLC